MGSGATVVSTTVWKGAKELVEGGTAISTTVESGGLEYISSGGTLGATTLNGGTLDVFGDVVSGASIAFTGVTAATLELGQTSQMSGSVTGFAAGDTIDLAGIAPASVSYTSGTLSVAGGQSFALSTTGSAGEIVHIGSDGSSGTALTLASATGPTLTTSGTVTYTGGGTAVALDAGATVTDGNAVTGGEVWINGGFVSGDQIYFTSQSGITGTFDAATGTLALTGSASAANWQTALDSITFGFSPSDGDPTQAGNSPSRTIDWQASDAGGSSAVTSSTVITQLASVLAYGATIDETGIVAASETVNAGGTLTLFNSGGTAVGSIDVGTSLSTADFILQPDGSSGTNLILDTVFGTYTNGVTLLTNPTTIASSGKATNTAASGAAIAGPSGTTWTLVNDGLISDTAAGGIGVTLAGGGTVSNQSGGTISADTGVFSGGNNVTLINAGSIRASTSSNATGVSLVAGGSVTNQSGATITGANGLYANGGVLALRNDGTITGGTVSHEGLIVNDGGTVGNGSSGLISGYIGAYIGRNAAVTLTNAGRIAGSSLVGGAGILGLISGQITNLSGGTVSGHYGIETNPEPGHSLTIVNAGSIAGQAVGINLFAAGTITNLSGGVISGSTAVEMRAGYVNRLAIAPGATFTSNVFGGNAIGSGTASTMELMSGSGTGTLSGLGSKYVDFAQVAIDAGASWSLSGTNTVAAGVTLSAAGTLIDAGSITNAGTITGSGSASELELASLGSTGTLTGFGSGIVNFTTLAFAGGAQWTVAGTDSANGLGGATISGFSYGDTIDITNFAAGSSSFKSNHLTLTSGASSITLDVSGAFVTSQFRLAGDGASGTDITLGPAVLTYNWTGGSADWQTATNWSSGVVPGTSASATIANTGSNTVTIGSTETVSVAGLTLSNGNTLLTDGGFTSTNGFYVNGASVSVASTGTISGSDGIRGTVSPAEVVNVGQITATGAATYAAGIYLTAGGAVTNLTGGVIRGHVGIYADAPLSVVNAGKIGGNDGVLVENASATIVNTGSIGSTYYVLPAHAYAGIYLQSGGLVSNQSGGTISGQLAIDVTGAAGTVSNAGSIDNAILLHGGGAVSNQSGGTISGTLAGLGIVAISGGTGTVVNAGAITSLTPANPDAVYLGGGGTVTNQSLGSITGALGVYIGGTTGSVINAGVITGAMSNAYHGVMLGYGGYLTNQFGGSITGDSAVLVTGGVATVSNAGFIEGSYGVTLGAGGLVANASGGTISGSTDAVKFASGYTNRLLIDPGAVFTGTVDGGNTIGAASVSTLELASGASAGTISGLGTQFVNFASIVIDSYASWSITGTNSIASGETMAIDYRGSPSVAGTLVNAGLIANASVGGLGVVSGGLISNQSGGTISGSAAGFAVQAISAGTIINAGLISNANTSNGKGIYLVAGGSVTNIAGGTISGDIAVYGKNGGALTVVNAGVILETGTLNSGDGIVANAAGSVSNQSGATISGYNGIFFSGSGATLTNAGQITGQAGGEGVHFGANSVLTNQSGGTISGGQGVIGAADSVVNAGLLQGVGTTPGSGYGVSLHSAGSVTNQSGGTITGAAAGVSAVGGTIVNQTGGLISGGTDAVLFSSGYAGRLVVYNGATFSGTVDGGNAIGASRVSTLELASGSGVGTISGVGSSFVDFGAIVFDAGAQWDIAGGDGAAALGGATISGFTYGDTIDITNFAASSRTFSSNALVLTNSAGSHATLHLPGTFTTANFAISSAGSGGTDIVLQSGPAILNYGTTIAEAGIVATSETVDAGGTLTLFNSGNTAVGTIDVGTSLSTGDFLLSNNGTSSSVILDTVFGTYTSGISLLTNPTTIAATAAVSSTSAGAAAILAPSGTNWTLVNQGVVSETASSGIGVNLKGDGTIINVADGTISGYIGIRADYSGTATVINAGSIGGISSPGGSNGRGIYLGADSALTNQAGGIISGFHAVRVTDTASTVVNAGTISGSSAAPGRGVLLTNGDSLTNQSGGTITGQDAVYGGGGPGGTAIAISNAGIIGDATDHHGVYLRAQGVVTNQAGGTISGNSYAVDLSYSSNLINQTGGVVSGGVRLSSGSTLTNQTGGVITGGLRDASAGPVTNAGSISGAVYGVYLGSGDTLTNQAGGVVSGYWGVSAKGAAATVVNAGAIDGGTTGAGYGVRLNAGGSITNQSGGTIAGHNGVIALAGVATVSNAGHIDGRYGVNLGAGGLVTNAIGGTIVGDTGVLIGGAAGTVQNAGLISGTVGAGISLTAGGTITNASGGTIAGATDAVTFASGYTNRLVIDPGAAFTGTVDGGNAIGATSISTLELASGSGTGTIDGIGSSFVDFGAIVLDTGAQWDLAGSDGTAGLGGATISGFTYGDTIDITNFAAGSSSFNSNKLTLTSGASSITLNVSGAFGASQFRLAGDGAVGTDITLGPAVVTYDWTGASGDWQTATNWSSDVVPGTSANATIANTGSNTVTIGSTETVSVAGLTLSNGDTLLVDGTFASAPGIDVSGATVSVGSTGTISGTFGVLGATAGTATVVNAGHVTASATGVKLQGGGAVSNQSSGAISGYYGVWATNAAAAVVNAGSILGNTAANAGTGIYLSQGGTVTNQSGLIGGAYGVFVRAGAVTVVNAGSIGGRLTASASGTLTVTPDGIRANDGGVVTNLSSGTISGFAGIIALGAAATVLNNGVVAAGTTTFVNPTSGATIYSSGVYLGAGGAVSNQSSGTISGYDGIWVTGGAASLVNAGVVLGGATAGVGVGLLQGGTLTNQSSGTIAAQYAVTARTIAATVINAGSIDGATAASGTITPEGVFLGAGGVVSNLSTGTITGEYAVVARTNATTVTNAGSIGGAMTAGGTITPEGVFLGAGGVVSNLSTGTITGEYAVVAENTAATVTNTGYIGGGTTVSGTLTPTGVFIGAGGSVTNNGTIFGAVAIAAAGSAVTVTDSGTLIGAGGTAVALGVGNDVLQFAASYSAFVQGTVDGGGGTNTLAFLSGASAGTLTGSNADLVNFTSGSVASGATWVLAGSETFGSGLTLTNSGSLSATGTLSNAGTIDGNPLTLSGASFTNKSGGLVTGTAFGVVARGASTLVNDGSLAANTVSGTAVSFVNGGVVSNQSGGSITGNFGVVVNGAAGTIFNSGAIAGVLATSTSTSYGILLASGGYVSNVSTGTISGSRAVDVYSGAATVINAGSIGTSTSLTSSAGIYLRAGGALTNQAGGVVSAYLGIVGKAAATTVVNAGAIGGGTTGFAYGVFLTGGGSITNQSGGTITGKYAVRSNALVPGATVTITNAGSIGGGSNGIGVYLSGGGTLTNLSGGVISGGVDAVTLRSGYTNRLVIDPGAVFHGTVDGGNAIGASSISTLELASGASVGTLHGVGSQYFQFAQITLDAGARWDIVSGYAGAALTGATVSGFTYGDTIDITNFAAVSRTFSSDALVLTNSARSNTTLYLPGTFTTGDIAISSDGSSGTDIQLQTGAAILNYGTTIDEGGIVAASETVNAGGTLTLFNSGSTAVATIDVGTSLSTGDFILQPDGSGGTNVVLDTVFGTYTNGVTLLTNPTTIAATAAVSASGSAGAAVYGDSGTISTVVNDGQVTDTGTRGSGIHIYRSGSVTNQSGGTISGHYGILGNGAALTVTNAGSVGGVYGIHLEAGGSVGNQSGGVIGGSATGVELDAGSSVNNAGTIAGGKGIVVYGTSAVSVIDSGSIIGTGGTAIGFAAGNDTLQFQPSSSAFIQGTVDGGGGTNTLAFLSGAATGTLTGSNAYFNHFTQGTVDAGASWVLAGTNTFGAGVSLSVGGTLTDTGTLSNAGTLNGEVTLSGALFTNQAGGLVQNGYLYGVSVASANSVANAGTISATSGYAIYFRGDGNVSNAAGGLITGLTGIRLAGSNASVINLGSINASQSFFHSYAVYLRDGGTVTNGQSGATSAVVTGYYGIGIHGAAGTVTNAGTVATTSTLAAAVYLANGGVVTNGSSALTTALLQGATSGVHAISGTVTNYGTIEATNSSSTSAGVLIDAGGTLNNLGSAAVIEGYFYGATLAGGGTVTNAGTIASYRGISGKAVVFGSGTDRLIIDPGAVFVGQVVGGSGTMELASAASAGTIAGLGSSVTNFDTLVFDAGAQWTVAGNDSASGLGTLAITGFGFGDTIDVTNFSAVSRTFSSNALVLTDVGGAHTTLDLQGSFSTSQVQIGSDGSGGTDIWLQNLPSIGAGGTVTFNGGGPAVVLDGSISLSDTGSTTLVSAEVAINSGSIAGDVLNYNSLSGLGITGSYDAATGTLTLSGTSTIADYQSALDSITYSFSPANGDPTGGGGDTSRGISWIVNDGSGQSPAAASIVDVVHVAPSITAGATATFDGGGSPVVLDGSIAVADVDSGGTLTGATVAINSGSIAGDVLNYTSLSGLGITGSYDVTTGTLTLSGTSSIANYESALDSVTYGFTAGGDPTGGGGDTSRGIAWSVNDGAATGNIAGSTLTDVHIAPSITASGTVGFSAGGTAVALDPGIAVSDPDSGGILTSATVSIAGGFLFGDLLHYTSLAALGITGTYSAGTGVLTLNGTSSVANYESALASITYSFSPGNGDPTGGGSDTSRGIAWQVSDGVALSNTGTSVLDAVHAAPTLTAGGTVTFTGGGAPIVLDGSVTVVDTNSGGDLVGATVAINSGSIAGDVLNYTSLSGLGITGSYDAATGTLTLSGTSSIANYESALDSVTYGFSAGGDPTGGGGDTSRGISWLVNDGVANSNVGTSTVDTVHVAPTITAGATATFTGGGSAVVLDGSIAVTDVDSGGTLTGATVAINSGSIAGDVLNYASLSGLGITGSYDAATGTLTLSGNASIANYESALDSVTYGFSAGVDPTGGGGDTSRGITWSVNDGVLNSNVGASTVDTVHVAPTITAGATATFDGGGSAVVLDGSIAVTDVDSGGTLTGATVAINSGSIAGDVLNYTSLSGLGITGSYDAATGTLTLSGTSSIANYESALDSVTYGFSAGGDPTGGGSDTSRGIAWSVNDGAAISNTASSTLTDVHVGPSITASGTVGFATGGGTVTLDPGVLVSDPDSGGVLSSATVAVAGGFLSGDMLNYASLTGLGIIGSYDTASGTLTLSGNASIASYESALASITYDSTAADPSNGGSDLTRTIDWLVNDGVAASNTGTSTLRVNGPSPILGGTSGIVATFIQQGVPVVLDSAVTLTDSDSTTLAGATVAITGGFLPGDTLAAVTAGTAITALYSNGTLTLSGTDTLATYQQVLRSLTYASSATDPTSGGSDFSRTITWQFNDGRGANNLSNIGTTTVDTHVRPVVTAGTTVTFATGGGVVQVEPGLGVADADTNPIVSGTVAIGGGLLSGDVLAFNNGHGSESFGDGATISASFNAATGTLAFSESGSLASTTDWQQALRSVTFDNSGTNPTSSGADPTRTLTWTLNTGNPNQTSVAVTSTIDLLPAPVISGTVSGQTTTDEAAIDPFSGVRVTDANAGQTETVTITLSSAANGTLSNLGGGTFNNGTYVVTGTALDVTAAVDGLVFTPTAHQVAPGDTVATGFTIGVVDSAHAASSDSSTSVIATAVNDPPTITEAVDHTGVPNENSASPFGVLTVADPDVGHTDTLTVTLSDPAGGTLSNLSGGSFNAATGVYTISGSAAQLTAALAALVFTPVPPADGSATATTQFTVSVAGPGGSATDTSISVTAVAQQVPGITNPATSNTISISPDGSGFTPATAGQTNEAVVSDPSAGGSYALPDGYQAAFLGGNADATLTDNAVGGAVLVGNSGNDTISAGANDDTLVGGSGDNTFRASGTSDVIGVTGVSTVSTSGSRDTVFAGAGALTLNDSGSGDAIGLSSGSANVTLSGGGASVFANTGSLSLVDDGTRDMIGGGSGPISATLGGSGSSVYGGSGALALDVASTASDAVIGTGRSDATITVAGSAATVYGGAGNLSADVLGDNAVIGLDGGTTALTLAGSAAKVFGGSGDLSVVDLGHGDTIGAGTGATTVRGGGSGAVVVGGGGDLTFVGGADEATVVGGSGSTTVIGGTGAMTLYGSAGGTLTYADGSGAITYQAGLGNETLQASGATSGAVINGGIDASGHDVLIGGAGNDSLFAGTGSATLSGGGGNNEFVFYKSVIAGNAPHDVITDFNANDTVYLAGYGSGEAVRDLSSATSSGGSTTITLSDNTRITFTNVSSANLLSGHIVSF